MQTFKDACVLYLYIATGSRAYGFLLPAIIPHGKGQIWVTIQLLTQNALKEGFESQGNKLQEILFNIRPKTTETVQIGISESNPSFCKM